MGDSSGDEKIDPEDMDPDERLGMDLKPNWFEWLVDRLVGPSIPGYNHGCHKSLKALKMQMGGFDPDFDEEERQPVNML